jgi:tetratricopeptide (TPR) repeat protein
MLSYKKILPIAVAATLATGMMGCNKQLDQVNPNEQTSASFWQTTDDAMKGVNAAYGSLIIDGTYMRFTPMLLDLRGDDARSNSPWDVIYNTGKFALGTANGAGYGWAYGSYYEGVSRANQVLDNVPNIDMDPELKNRIIGQAYFLRGLCFFHLVNMFGNVALPTTSPKSTAEFFSEQKTQEEGWAQVISDFSEAENLLPVTYASVTGPDKDQKGRATKGAAMAYLGKAYLFTKQYAEAAAKFKSVIDLGIYDLVPNYRDNFTEANENNVESVFEVQFSREAGGKDLGWGGAPASGWGKTSARAITYAPRGFGWTDVQPTWALFNDFLKEKTASNEDDPRLVATMFYNKPGLRLYGRLFSEVYANNAQDLNDLFVRKYQNDDNGRADEFDWRSGINERIMRYADVLMMYAEALNELGRTDEAYPLIQRVRARVGMADLATVKPGMTQAQMRDQIAHERMLEFALEGHRFDDIRRWGWLSNPAKLAELKARDPEFNSYTAGRELFPIPQIDIDNNPGWVQNSGY